jgi:hypothetical protein
MNDLLPAAALVLLAAVIIAVVWLIGTSRRAAAAAATYDASYKKLLDRAVEAQEATERRLGEMAGELARMNERVRTVERILKDAE